jgi:hypothetical protein
LKAIPRQRARDVVLVDPCDFEHSVGINFLECKGPNKQVQMNFIVNEMVKIFDRLYDLSKTGGPMFEQYMRNALFLVMESKLSEPTLMDIPMVFEDDDFRRFLKRSCRNPIVESFWGRQAELVRGEASLENIAPYITCKLNQFTTNALLRPIIGQSKSTIDFRGLIDNRKILLVNLSKGLLGELDTQLLGMLIIGKLFCSAMGRVSLSPESRRPVFLYVDEFQNFTTDTVAHMISEARKFGIYLTLANQNMTQLQKNEGKENILETVLGNVGTILFFRLGAADAEKLETYTKPELCAQDLQYLSDFHVVGKLLSNNSPSRPFVFNTLPISQPENSAGVGSIIKVSRKKYTVPTEQVEFNIIKRRTSWKQ